MVPALRDEEQVLPGLRGGRLGEDDRAEITEERRCGGPIVAEDEIGRICLPQPFEDADRLLVIGRPANAEDTEGMRIGDIVAAAEVERYRVRSGADARRE